jgi:2-iminobutanoate/2-iminopropanoate deaminase
MHSQNDSFMNIQRKNYKCLGEPVGPYVHAVKHNGVLYLSGLTAYGTEAQSGEIDEQARAIFGQIERICKEENSDLTELIKVTIFVTELSRMDKLREALFEIYGDNLPASSLIQVAQLFSKDIKIEIEALLAIQ